jgi:hypothetical protein
VRRIAAAADNKPVKCRRCRNGDLPKPKKAKKSDNRKVFTLKPDLEHPDPPFTVECETEPILQQIRHDVFDSAKGSTKSECTKKRTSFKLKGIGQPMLYAALNVVSTIDISLSPCFQLCPRRAAKICKNAYYPLNGHFAHLILIAICLSNPSSSASIPFHCHHHHLHPITRPRIKKHSYTPQGIVCQ